MITETDPVVLFGKIPAQGDFVRVNADYREVAWFDRWLQQGLLKAKESHRAEWDSLYDSAAAVNFMAQPPDSERVMVGTLIPSRDKGDREYPLWIAALVGPQVVGGDEGIPLPATYGPFLEAVHAGLQNAKMSSDTRSFDDLLAQLRLTQKQNTTGMVREYHDFVASETVVGFARRCSGGREDTGPGSLFPGLFHLLHPLYGSDVSTWGLVVRYPLGAGPLRICDVSYWFHCTMKMLGGPRCMPFLAWTAGEKSAYLHLVFKPPPVGLFAQLLRPDDDNDDIFRLDSDGSAPNTGNVEVLGQVLRNDKATLSDLLREL